MTPADVLTHARACGAVLAADDGRLRVKDSSSLSGNLRQAIFEHRAAILKLLEATKAPKPATVPATFSEKAVERNLVADVLAMFPGAEVVEQRTFGLLTPDVLEVALRRFIDLAISTFPNRTPEERAHEAFRCLAVILNRPPEATERMVAVAQAVVDRLDAMAQEEVLTVFAGREAQDVSGTTRSTAKAGPTPEAT